MDSSWKESLERADAFQAVLKYRFRKIDLLAKALTHSSYVFEHLQDKLSGNERLEFLGDAVLNLVTSHMVTDRFPDRSAGDLTRIRASIVNEKALATISRQIKLGRFLLLGKGENQAGGREKASILSDCYEAIVAAVYLDGGYEEAFRMLQSHFSGVLTRLAQKTPRRDSKSYLQEQTQKLHQAIPRYAVVRASGPDHDKEFCVSVSIEGVVMGYGEGKTKKEAEQRAAQEALGRLRTNGK